MSSGGREHIQAQGRTSVLRVNYRNPCRILNFAYAFSRDYFESHHNQELPLVLPEACGEEGEIPDIELCHSEAEEARRAVAWLKVQHVVAGRWGDIAVLCPTRYSADRLPEKTRRGRNHLSPWTVKEMSSLENNYGKFSAQDIGDTLGRSAGAVRGVARKLGLSTPRPPVWTEEELALIRVNYYKGIMFIRFCQGEQYMQFAFRQALWA